MPTLLRITFAVLCFLACMATWINAEAEPRWLEAIQETYNRGEARKAQKDLSKLQKKFPDWQEAYYLKGQIHTAEGEIDEAIEAWSAGLMDTEGDLNFHQAIIQLHLQIAEHGLNPPQNNSFITVTYNDRHPEETEKLKKEHKQKAIAAIQLALISHPDWREGIALCSNLLFDEGRIDESEEQLQHLIKLNPNYPEALVIQSKISSARNDYAQALKYLDRAEVVQPNGALIHTQRWEIRKLMGDKAALDAAWRKMIFYQMVPAFTYLDYSPENFDRFQSITQIGNGTEESTDEENKALQEAANAGALALLDYEGDDRLDWIIATLWQHRHHGKVEDDLYDALIHEEAVIEVNQLLDSATNNCTARGCFRVLSELGDMEGLAKAIQLLPFDTDFIWHMNTAGALARWGDPQAIEPLIKKLTIEAPKITQFRNIDLSRFGYEDARLRAALALGHFKDPRIEKELKKHLRKKDIGAACYVSLFRMTGDASFIEELRKNAPRRKYENLIQVIASFRGLDTTMADELYATFVDKGLIEETTFTIKN